MTGASVGRPASESAQRGVSGARARALACSARSGWLGSISQSSAAASAAGSTFSALSASLISVPSPGPTSTRISRAGRSISLQVSAHHRPISSPNICETCGAVMKSPSAPMRGRQA